MESYRELILENIDYDILLERNPWDKDLLDGYVELMLEICCSTRESVRICGQEIPTEVVKSRFLKLNSEHIGYVMDTTCDRITYNDLCRGCTHSCKQSFRAVIILCPRYYSKRRKKEDRDNGR